VRAGENGGVGFPAGERILYREHLWTPWWLNVYMFVLCEGSAAVIILTTHPSLGSDIFGLFASTAIPVAVVGLFTVAAHRTWNVVGERTWRFGRARAFPVSAVRSVTVMRGRKQVDREKRRLRGNARFFGSSSNPALKGILAPPRTETAVRVEVDPAVSHTQTFLVGTRDPDRLIEALTASFGAAPAESG
jgi:hypothetical protein